MTTKTTDKPTAALPVLDSPQLNTDEDFDLFADHLARWCAQWVPTISVPIMRKAHDLYADTAVCILLGKWYDLKLQTTKDMHARLLRAANDDEWGWEKAGADDEFSEGHSFDINSLRSYNDALRVLLITG